MAPRYPSLYDAVATSSSSSSSSSSPIDYPILDSTLEFKPRLDLWASNAAWIEPQQQQPLRTSNDDAAVVKDQKPAKKRVRFSTTNNQTQLYISHQDFTSEEKQACWFTRFEFREMRHARQQTIDQLAAIGKLEDEWGLETATNNYIYYEIRQAQNAVLEEQDDQLRWDGRINDDILSARYMAYTMSSKDRAQWLANQYAKEVAREKNGESQSKPILML